jgi:hypothetical protein
MVDNVDVLELEPYVRSMVAHHEVERVPQELAAAVACRIAHTRLAEFQGCSAMHMAMFVWEVFVLFDKEKVTREQALPAMRVLDKVVARMSMKIFKPIDVAQLTLNFAKFGLADARWFDRVAVGEATALDWEGQRGARRMEQSIANTIYGLGLASRPSLAPFVNHLLAASMTKLASFDAQNISNTLWALAKMHHPLDSPQLLAATGHKDAASLVAIIMEVAVLPQLHHFNSAQEVGNTVYALVLLKMAQGPQVMDALVSWMVHLLDSGHGEPQPASNCMWALSAGGYSDAALKLQRPLHAFLVDSAVEWTPQEPLNVAFALAKLTHHSPELVRTVVDATMLKWSKCNGQDVSNLLWSLAVLEPRGQHNFFQDMQPLLCSRVATFDEQVLADVAWAYAVVLGDETSKQLALSIFRAASALQGKIPAEGLAQLFQLMAVSSSEVQAAVASDMQLQRLRQRCRLGYTAIVEPHFQTPFDKEIKLMLPVLHGKFDPSFTVDCYGVPLRTRRLLETANWQQRVLDLVPSSKYSSHSTTSLISTKSSGMW